MSTLFQNFFKYFSALCHLAEGFSYTQKQEVIFMYCPRDGRCVFDGYKTAGKHICALPRCQYPRELKQALQNRIANILGQPQGRTRRARELELLKEQIRKITMQEG